MDGKVSDVIYKVFTNGGIGYTLSIEVTGEEERDELSKKIVGKYNTPGALMVAVNDFCPEIDEKSYDSIMDWLSGLDGDHSLRVELYEPEVRAVDS